MTARKEIFKLSSDEFYKIKTADKARGWTLLVYPETMVSGWVDYLLFKGNNFAFSLHNGYTNGNKDHFHIMLWFDNPVTQKKADSYLQAINPGTNLHAQIIGSDVGLMRYMIDADNPEKPQYPKGQIYCHGQEVLDLLEEAFDENRTKAGKRRKSQLAFFRVGHLIFDNKLHEWPQLFTELEKLNDFDLTMFVNQYAFLVDKWLTAEYLIMTRPPEKNAQIEAYLQREYENNKDKLKNTNEN